MQPLQNCIGPTICIGREIICLPYAGFLKRDQGFEKVSFTQKKNFTFFLKQSAKNVPGVAGGVLQTVTD